MYYLHQDLFVSRFAYQKTDIPWETVALVHFTLVHDCYQVLAWFSDRRGTFKHRLPCYLARVWVYKQNMS